MREFKVYWNGQEKIPVMVDEESDNVRIKNENLEYMTTDLRPVFLEEKHLIKELFSLNEDVYESSVWCTKQGKYIIDGERVKKSAVKEAKNLKDIESFRDKILSFKKTPGMIKKEKEIFDKFIELNRQYLYYLLESKERDDEGHYIGAYPFVNEVSEKYKNRVNMVSFSGGKDSTVVSHLVRKALNNQSILHIFGDTTLELPKTYEYVEEFKENNPMTPFFDEKNEENNFFEMCEEIGPPSRVMAWCCSIFKTGPMGTTLSNFDENFLTFYGVRRKESTSRSKYPKILQSTKIDKQLSISPVIDWLDIDIWLYLLSEKEKFNDSYRYGFARVGCWVCPHRSFWSDFITQIYNYDIAKNWKKFLYKFAENINKVNPKDYIDDEKWKLRRGGNGLKIAKFDSSSKQCIEEKNSYNFELSREINEEFYSLLKPFGQLKFNYTRKEISEVIILKNENPLFKILISSNLKNIKVTILNIKDRYLINKVKKQINKYNFCLYCQACNSICPVGAISVTNKKYMIDEKVCINCLKCVTRFDEGCIVARTVKTK